MLQQIFRGFMDEVGPGGDSWERSWRPMGTDPLSMALGRLRALVDVQVGEISAAYGLSVSAELATIVPNQAGWFFERFDDRHEDDPKT